MYYWKKICIIGLLISLTFLAKADNSFDSCSYYNRLEDQLHCGDESYINKFAQPYCETYLNKNHYFSQKGKKILRNIRKCLQDSLSSKENILNCSNIETYGFESHYSCYLQNGFCDLNQFDLVPLYWIAKKEILNPQIWKMLIEIKTQCLWQAF